MRICYGLLMRIVLLIVFVAIVAGFLYYFYRLDNRTEQTMNNADVMRNGNEVAILTEDAEYYPGTKGYFARPEASGQYPGVVMVHENKGLRPEIKEAADMLAQEGYLVLAVDLFNGQIAEDQDAARAMTAGFNQATGTENMRAAAKFLRDRGATKMASLGWCFGGRQSVEFAISGELLDATVVYYGGGLATTTEALEAIKWPVLGIFGENDEVIPPETVRAFEVSLKELGVENEIHIYPGVGHAFANPSGANYAPDATRDAWGKTLAFLEKHLK